MLRWLQRWITEWRVVTVCFDAVKTLVKMVKMVMMVRIQGDKCIAHK